MFKLFGNFYCAYFKVFTELSRTDMTDADPSFTILYYKGRKRRKLVASQYTD